MGILLIWEWNDADPAKRVGIPMLILIQMVLFAFLLGMGWLNVRLNRTVTTLREEGISYGPRFKQRWIPWFCLEWFYVDEQSVESTAFRFINWKERDEDQKYSVLPDTVDQNLVIEAFKSKSIKEIDADEA